MKHANNYFGNSNGSGNFFCHKPSLILYTDGVKAMAEGCEAYWLKDINLERFQVWDLNRVKDNIFLMLCTDGNHNKVTSQEIEFSAFSMTLQQYGWLMDA